MLCGSAVDAMLKAHNYTTGSLYSRIDKAKEDGIITEGMAKWSHRVRLDANKPRHADKDAPLPDEKDAKRSFEFSMALGEILFVLPARVTSGIASGTGGEDESN